MVSPRAKRQAADDVTLDEPFGVGWSYRIGTVQELLGYQDVSTTMIHTHVLNRGPSVVRSSVDRMFL